MSKFVAYILFVIIFGGLITEVFIHLNTVSEDYFERVEKTL